MAKIAIDRQAAYPGGFKPPGGHREWWPQPFGFAGCAAFQAKPPAQRSGAGAEGPDRGVRSTSLL